MSVPLPPLQRLRQAPRHLLVCEKGHARHERSRHAAHVRDHAYNCRVSFLIPECGVLPEVLKSTIADVGEYYLVRNLSVHELVAHEFIDAFVKKGSCYALTYNTKIDQDNTAALLPNGKLILSVDKDTYEELGLQGRPSRYSGKKAMRYIITIDLTDSGFHPDSKKHNRVLWALKEKKPLEFDFLLAWYNTGAEGSTLMSYFSKNQIQALKPKITFSTLRDLQCPVLQSNELQGKPEESCSTEELFEWLGAVLSQVTLRDEEDQKNSITIFSFCIALQNLCTSNHSSSCEYLARMIMVQLLKHRKVSFSNVSKPVKDSLKETASDPGFMQIRKFEQGKDIWVQAVHTSALEPNRS